MALDVRSDRVGEVMETTPTRVFLRPCGGGREWEARAEDVRPARVLDVLRTKVKAVNVQRYQGACVDYADVSRTE